MAVKNNSLKKPASSRKTSMTSSKVPKPSQDPSDLEDIVPEKKINTEYVVMQDGYPMGETVRFHTGGLEDLDIDRKKVKDRIELGYVYQIRFQWYRGALNLKENHGEPIGRIIYAKKLFAATQMRECLCEWYYDLDPKERRAFKRQNAQLFD